MLIDHHTLSKVIVYLIGNLDVLTPVRIILRGDLIGLLHEVGQHLLILQHLIEVDPALDQPLADRHELVFFVDVVVQVIQLRTTGGQITQCGNDTFLSDHTIIFPIIRDVQIQELLG